MGGKYEDTIEAPSKRGKAVGATVGKIRFHENAGEVHFHDDAAGLKVAMPVHVWVDAWARLNTGDNPAFAYIDAVNGTSLTVTLVASDGKIDASLDIEEVKVGKSFEKLQKFTEAT